MMAARFVIGRSGSGKTWFCQQEIKERYWKDKAKTPLIYIVPEQFNLEAEKSLITHMGSDVLYNAVVLSFQRLAHRVIQEVGGQNGAYINNAGKRICLMNIVTEIKEQLQYFSRMLDSDGFIDNLSTLFTVFKRFELTRDGLEQALSKSGDLILNQKLSELYLIYEKYCQRIGQNYLDTDDDLTRLAKIIQNSIYLQNAEIWIDGFSGFSMQERSVIIALCKKTTQVTICLCCDDIPENRADIAMLDLFAPVKRTAMDISEDLSRHNIPLMETVRLSAAQKAVENREDALCYLEAHLYQYWAKPYQKLTNAIETVQCKDYFEEAEYAAQDILKMCREERYSFGDIAILCPDLDAYAKLIKPLFEWYGINCFVDIKKDITDYPIVHLILSLFSILESDYRYEAVFSYLKTGMTDIESEEVDLIENYVLANGIFGKMWTMEKAWLFGNESDEVKACINAIRYRILKPIQTFVNTVSACCSADVFCLAVYRFLNECGAQKKVLERIKTSQKERDRISASSLKQIWSYVMEVLEQIHELEVKNRTLTEYAKMFACGIRNYQVGVIPPAMDEVLVGSLDRTRSHPVKLLYIIGANDGVFPGIQINAGILNEADLTALSGLGLELGKDSLSAACEGQFNVYSALTIPTQRLKIFWAESDSMGKTLRPSNVIQMLDKLFPQHKMTVLNGGDCGSDDGQAFAFQTETPTAALDGLIAAIREKLDENAASLESVVRRLSAAWQAVYRLLCEDDRMKSRITSVLPSFIYQNPKLQLSSPLTERLMNTTGLNEVDFISVSRLEQYAACPFSYFSKYVLNAKERPIYRLEMPDIGTFIHKAIELTAKMIQRKDQSELMQVMDINNPEPEDKADTLGGDVKLWGDLDLCACEKLSEKVINQMLEQDTQTVFLANRRNVFLAERIKKVVAWSVFSMGKHFLAGVYQPWNYEVEFTDLSYVLALKNGKKVGLHGKIDRVDVAFETAEADAGYVRVIDFKTGHRDISMDDIYQGLTYQLPIYLEMAMKLVSEQVGMQRTLLPGGMFYFEVKRPILNLQKKGRTIVSDEEVESELLALMGMNGIVIGDEEIYKKTVEKDIQKKSKVVKGIQFKKDGSYLKTVFAPDTDEFKLIRQSVLKNMQKLCVKLFDGDFAINPYRKKTKSPCTYCVYKGICRVELCPPGRAFRVVETRRDTDVLELMRKDFEESKGNDGNVVNADNNANEREV